MHHRDKTIKGRSARGFTLVELMLAMAFFSSILAISSATFVQVLGIYNKGVAVKQMNQAGRTLTDNLIRNANQGYSNIRMLKIGGERVVCMRLGSTTYLLSFYDNDNTTPSTYRFTTNDEPVNFVRYNTSDQPCPPLDQRIDPIDVSPVIGDTLRVYETDIVRVVPGEDKLLRFKIVLGTYTGAGSSNNPTISGDKMVCPTDNLGDFCATSTYETVLYLPNQGGS